MILIKRTIKWLLLPFLFLASSSVYAEGSCPPGLYPIGAASGQSGPQSCAPIPGYNQQQQTQTESPSRLSSFSWASRWGAIATYAPTGVIGTSANAFNQKRAEERAMEDCTSKGGAKCKIEAAYSNGCAAVVVSNISYVVTTKPELKEAVSLGMKTCNDGGGKGCHVYYSECSLPLLLH